MHTFDRIISGVAFALVGAIAVVLAAGDHSGVRIREVYPANGSQPPSTLSIRVEFAEPMQQVSTEANFSLEPAAAGTVQWEGNTFVFTPASAFGTGITYTATIRAGALSDSGRTLQKDRIWTFSPRKPSVLYLTDGDNSAPSLWSIDPETRETREIYASDYGVYDFSVSRDGQELAVTTLNADGTSSIWLMNANGLNPRMLPACARGSCSGPAWSPDGKLIAYEKRESRITGSPGSNRIWLYDVGSKTTSPLFEDEEVLGFAPHWNRDGTQLAFFDANSEAIRILNMATGRMTMVPNQMGEVGSFGPDERYILYADIRLVGRMFFPELWIADLGDQFSMQPLLENAEEDQSPSWSPDGRWAAFTRRRLDRSDGVGRQLVLIDPHTLEISQLTEDNLYNNTSFAWSPSGQQILFQRFNLQQSASKPELWIVDVGTNAKTLLIENAFQGEWSP